MNKAKNPPNYNLGYNTKRQKNNEAAKSSRLKKKEHEMEIVKKKQKLEKTYVQLQKQISRIKCIRG